MTPARTLVKQAAEESAMRFSGGVATRKRQRASALLATAALVVPAIAFASPAAAAESQGDVISYKHNGKTYSAQCTSRIRNSAPGDSAENISIGYVECDENIEFADGSVIYIEDKKLGSTTTKYAEGRNGRTLKRSYGYFGRNRITFTFSKNWGAQRECKMLKNYWFRATMYFEVKVYDWRTNRTVRYSGDLLHSNSIKAVGQAGVMQPNCIFRRAN